MGLEDADKIDMIVKSPDTGGFDLIIIESEIVTDESKRYKLMINKLGAYAHFVIGGQFYETHPEGKGKPVRFCVICRTSPNEAMLKVEGIKPRNNPGTNIPVVFQMADNYLDAIRETAAGKNLSGDPADSKKRK